MLRVGRGIREACRASTPCLWGLRPRWKDLYDGEATAPGILPCRVAVTRKDKGWIAQIAEDIGIRVMRAPVADVDDEGPAGSPLGDWGPAQAEHDPRAGHWDQFMWDGLRR